MERDPPVTKRLSRSIWHRKSGRTRAQSDWNRRLIENRSNRKAHLQGNLLSNLKPCWEFQNFPNSESGAALISQRPYSVNTQRILLMCWDTAGQEEFDALTSAYYRGKAAVFHEAVQIYFCLFIWPSSSPPYSFPSSTKTGFVEILLFSTLHPTLWGSYKLGNFLAKSFLRES